MTVPVTMPSSSLIFSIVPQARSYCAPLLGQDQATLLVLLLEDQGLDPRRDRDDVVEGRRRGLMDSSRLGMTPSVL